MGCNDEPHLTACLWNIAAIMHYEYAFPETMDLPDRMHMPLRELQKYCVHHAGAWPQVEGSGDFWTVGRYCDYPKAEYTADEARRQFVKDGIGSQNGG